MAAVTSASTPPPGPNSLTSSPSSTRRKPVPPLPPVPAENYNWDGVKPLPPAPLSGSPRLRQSPVSPVRMALHQEDWAQPSNANIEVANAGYSANQSLLNRDLPQSPDAPPPPPHTPLDYTSAQHQNPMEQPVPTIYMYPGETQTGHTQAGYAVQDAYHGAGDAQTGLEAGMGKLSTTYQDAGAAGYHVDMTRDHEDNRNSRETDTTVSTTQQQPSIESSATTSASSVSGINEASDCPEISGENSPESSIEDGIPGHEQVPQLQYHHQPFTMPRVASTPLERDPRAASTPDLPDTASAINRHLTPTSNFMRRSSLPRPQSAYSAFSDLGPRSLSPGGSQLRSASAARRSPDSRPSSYADMLAVPYPQPQPAPISFDNAKLRNAVGSNASLLSAQKTLEMYRQNVKKTNDYSIQYSFAVLLITTAQEQGLSHDDPKRTKSPKPVRDLESSIVDGKTASSPQDLVREARSILQRLSNAGYPFAQYYLADGYASGLFSKGKEDYNSAFPLFVLAAKHGHAESAYRTALCYEFGWGCRKDPAKAVQFLRTAASKRHPGAMTRLGRACLLGDLGEKRYREGIKWLKLATESADSIYNAAPYHLGCLYETGYGDDIFMDESYAAELFTQAADLGNPEASFRMGDAYEHGKLNCPRDPALSVHFYTGAAERGHPGAMMGLCAWYMVGAEPILEKDEEEAYEWARRSAELGYVKAEYAVGYFTEMGIGCRRDILEANVWYVKAADAGDDRAKQRLAAIRAAVSGGTPMEVGPPRSGKIKKAGSEKEDNCVVM